MANKLVVAPAPHVQTSQSTARIMRDVVIALMPALAVSSVVFGVDVLRVTALSVAACVLFEYLIQKFLVRGASTIGNWSAVVTGVLLAFNLPASIPWWIVLIGAFVAIAIAKMTFGGLGKNPFNPALVGRVFLLIAYPVQMTSFPVPVNGSVDALSGATPPAAGEDGAAYDENGDGLMSFVELMNRKAAELGCTNTHFMNPHGLHDENHYTTAREMAAITEFALTLPYFSEITSQTSYTQPPTNLTSEARTVTTTNRMLVETAEEHYTYATGIKTGSLNESGYCIAASASYDGYSYLCICLGSPYLDADGNHIDYHGEMYDAATLFRWALTSIENKTIVTDGDLIGEVDLKYVWNKDRIQVVAKGNVTAMLPTDLDESSIKMTLSLPDAVKAPVAKGDEVGTATYTYKGEVLAEVPLVAAESVERSEIIQTIEQGKEIITSPWFLITAGAILVLLVVYIALAVLMNRKRRKMRRVKKYRDL